MLNTLDYAHLEPWLQKRFRYESQWVLKPITSKQEFEDYIVKKLICIKQEKQKILAEIGYLDKGSGRRKPCVFVCQDTSDNMIAIALVEVSRKISRIDLCIAPFPHKFIRTGEYPA